MAKSNKVAPKAKNTGMITVQRKGTQVEITHQEHYEEKETLHVQQIGNAIKQMKTYTERPDLYGSFDVKSLPKQLKLIKSWIASLEKHHNDNYGTTTEKAKQAKTVFTAPF